MLTQGAVFSGIKLVHEIGQYSRDVRVNTGAHDPDSGTEINRTVIPFFARHFIHRSTGQDLLDRQDIVVS